MHVGQMEDFLEILLVPLEGHTRTRGVAVYTRGLAAPCRRCLLLSRRDGTPATRSMGLALVQRLGAVNHQALLRNQERLRQLSMGMLRKYASSRRTTLLSLSAVQREVFQICWSTLLEVEHLLPSTGLPQRKEFPTRKTLWTYLTSIVDN